MAKKKKALPAKSQRYCGSEKTASALSPEAGLEVGRLIVVLLWSFLMSIVA